MTSYDAALLRADLAVRGSADGDVVRNEDGVDCAEPTAAEVGLRLVACHPKQHHALLAAACADPLSTVNAAGKGTYFTISSIISVEAEERKRCRGLSS